LYAPLISSPHAQHATTISFFFICSPEYLVGNTSHKAALQDMLCYIHKMWKWFFVFSYVTLWGKKKDLFQKYALYSCGRS
jgi:hypothetical protein